MIENTLNQWFITVAGEHDGEELITEGEMEHFLKSKFIPLLKEFMGRDISHYEVNGMVNDLLLPVDEPANEHIEPPVKEPAKKESPKKKDNKKPAKKVDKKEPLK